MEFRQRSIQNFQRMYLQRFGERLSDEEAKRKAEYLLGFYRIVFGLPSIEEFFDNKIDEKAE
jgi:hypothetical protein